MVVKCDKCGSDDVVLMTRIDVAFKFDENGDVKLIADLADDIYWRVEYEGLKAICYCHSCGRCFKYKGDWNIVKKVDTNLRRMKKVCRFKIIG